MKRNILPEAKFLIESNDGGYISLALKYKLLFWLPNFDGRSSSGKIFLKKSILAKAVDTTTYLENVEDYFDTKV